MKNKKLRPESILLIIGFLIGILLCVFTPFGTGFDEEAHLARVFDVSGLHLLPNRSIYDKTVSFAEFHSLSYRRFDYRDQGFELFSKDYFQTRANWDDMAIEETVSIYPPLMYIPQAIVAGIGWRMLDLPILPVGLLLRIVGLSTYLIGCYHAIKILPVGKWGLLVIALSPTALYQAATVNGDGFTNAASFLFIALIVTLALKSERIITRNQLLLLCLTVFLVGMAKPGSIVLFLLVLILPKRIFQTKSQIITLWASIVLMIIFHVAWMFIAYTNFRGGQEGILSTLGTVITQLVSYLEAFARSMAIYYKDLFSAMIASYGYWIGDVPALVFWIVPFIFFFSLLISEKNGHITGKTRLFFFAMLLIGWLAVLVLYTLEKFTPGNQTVFPIIQGRYLIAFLPLLVLSLGGLFQLPAQLKKPLQMTILIGVIASLGLFFWGLYARYYTTCGPSFLSLSSCPLPAYQNLETANPPQILLEQDAVIEQEFTNTCRNLQEVQVFVNQVPAGTSGSVEFSVNSMEEGRIAGISVDVTEMVKGQIISLDLNSLPPLSKGDYTINLDPRGLDGDLGLAIREPDVYPGVLTNGEVAVDGDLIFYYICEPVGLFKY